MIGSCSWGLCPGCIESVGRPCLSGCSDTGSGDKMAIGVSRRWVRPLILGRLSGGCWQQQGCGELTAVHLVVGRETLPDVQGSGSGCEYLIAEVAQRVMAAAGQLAGDRQQRQLAIQPGFDLSEVGVVG